VGEVARHATADVWPRRSGAIALGMRYHGGGLEGRPSALVHMPLNGKMDCRAQARLSFPI
jgi:hypothetical protein